MFFRTVPEHKMRLPTAEEALPGRAEPVVTSEIHAVLGRRIQPPFRSGLQQLVVGMGCFWGAERLFWQLDGVYSTAVGYSAGLTPNPTYEEVCSGLTGHNEVVLVVFDPERLPLEELLRVFWENHDPTSGMRQGNDRALSTARASTPSTSISAPWPKPAVPSTPMPCRPPAWARSPRRLLRPGNSITPRTTISSICTRIRPDTAA